MTNNSTSGRFAALEAANKIGAGIASGPGVDLPKNYANNSPASRINCPMGRPCGHARSAAA
jgi:hypothetical protein